MISTAAAGLRGALDAGFPAGSPRGLADLVRHLLVCAGLRAYSAAARARDFMSKWQSGEALTFLRSASAILTDRSENDEMAVAHGFNLQRLQIDCGELRFDLGRLISSKQGVQEIAF